MLSTRHTLAFSCAHFLFVPTTDNSLALAVRGGHDEGVMCGVMGVDSDVTVVSP
ncbi:hypothetical protein JNB_06444 [Janibacter sp. HTCC2649]|nr:hypothetical protein JNB_06444 [Janibacter sp. HTCC2649]